MFYIATDFTGHRTLAHVTAEGEIVQAMFDEPPSAFATVAGAIRRLMDASAKRAAKEGVESTLDANAEFGFYIVDERGEVVGAAS